MNTNVLYIVVPCYNEEKVLPVTCQMFLDELNTLIEKDKISKDSKILFVNDGSTDGSTDGTWAIISKLAREYKNIIGISQSRNRGHQNALLAGLMEARNHCDIVISIDCDGQDDITAIERMVDSYYEGNDIVYGVRDNRDTDSFFKKNSALGFYWFISKMGVEVVYNHADYRLLSKRVLDAFSEFKEVNLFLRGLIPLVGFKSSTVYYSRNARLAGESHYPLRKMLGLALDGITSLSIKPIRIITTIGFLISIISFIFIFFVIIGYFNGNTISGWASLISILCFLGGIQLVCLGILGEYIGKIYLEVKSRPRYIISERTENSHE